MDTHYHPSPPRGGGWDGYYVVYQLLPLFLSYCIGGICDVDWKGK